MPSSVPVYSPDENDMIRFSNSREAVREVFTQAIIHRVQKGNLLVKRMSDAGSKIEVTARLAASSAPVPTYKPKMNLEKYWILQARAALNPKARSAFNNGKANQRPLSFYLNSFFDRAAFENLPPAIYVTTVIYLGRVMARNPAYFLTDFNSHSLIMGAFMAAVKYSNYDDEVHDAHEFRLVNDDSKSTLDKIELAFLKAIDNYLEVTKAQYEIAESELFREVLNGPYRLRVICKLIEFNIMEVAEILKKTFLKHANISNPYIRGWSLLSSLRKLLEVRRYIDGQHLARLIAFPSPEDGGVDEVSTKCRCDAYTFVLQGGRKSAEEAEEEKKQSDLETGGALIKEEW